VAFFSAVHASSGTKSIIENEIDDQDEKSKDEYTAFRVAEPGDSADGSGSLQFPKQ